MGEFSETRLVQAKYSGDAGRSYRASGVARNEAADGRLDRVGLEALHGQVAGGCRRPASLRRDPLAADPTLFAALRWARSVSGSSAARAASAGSGPTLWRSRSSRIAAAPEPR